MIISATNTFITEPIAQYLGVDALLGTDLECVNGIYTGRMTGVSAFQEGKVEKLDQWLKSNEHNLSGSYFYSDSHNDLPLLEQVENPVAVDPDNQLQNIASQPASQPAWLADHQFASCDRLISLAIGCVHG